MLRDLIHEYRIRLYCWPMVWHHEGRQRAQARFLAAINARSDRQVDRMTKAKGLN